MRYLFLAFCFIIGTLTGQELPSLNITRTTDHILIDGQLLESVWSNADIAGGFHQNFPYDTSLAETMTEVMMCYDDDFIYVAAICYDDLEGDYVVQSLKRDFSYPVSDAFAIYLDPFDDKTNGFSFAVNPYGVQREGLLEGGAGRGVTTAWDNKWYSEVTRQEDRWIVEMAIPFKSIRFNEGTTEWGINFSRNDLKRNENSAWSRVPRNFNIANMAFTGRLIWDAPVEDAGTNISVIPYVIGNMNAEYDVSNATELGWNAGGDAKVAVSSSLNLDLTFNPDFSQVDVDRQVTNLSRFSLFFPERRQFFIENSDLFGQRGFRQIRPFFSRRIGLDQGQTIPILFGARLSGKLNRNWRIGFLNMQTEGVGDLDLDGQNYTMAVFQRQLWARSNIGAIFVNRQGFEGSDINGSDYNRIAGFDFNLNSGDGKWLGKAFYHHSFTPQVNDDNFAHATWLMYNSQTLFAEWNHEYVGRNYFADVGFVPRVENFNPITGEVERKSYWRFEPGLGYSFYPTDSKINKHGPRLFYSHYLDGQYRTTVRETRLNYTLDFQNTAKFQVMGKNTLVKLFFDTDVTFSGNPEIDAGTYEYNEVSFWYASNSRKLFTFNLGGTYGTYFIGHKLTLDGELNLRVQPWGIFSLAVQQNEITMPDPYEGTSLTLIGPKIELSFTRSLFFTTFVQYNTQIENLNINSRLQWRFKPMSDLFIVYTENYETTDIGIKNRALVVKLVYWLNL